MVDQSLVLRVAVLAGLAVSLLVVRRLDRPGGEWGRRLRSRLLLGVPWGTLVSVALVLAVYLVVQGGFDDPYRPVTLPFHSWSYLYPLGWLTAPFAHSGLGHLTGNLLGTLVLGSLAEYAWGHFPTARGESTFADRRSNPYVRAFLYFPLGVVGVALATAVLSWGPVIGFSGVVFAFAGFALVRYPLGAVVALTGEEAVSTVYHALRDPVVVQEATETFSRPWWYGVAVQGHLLGLLLGVVVGVLVFGERDDGPSALRLWTGTLLLSTAMTVWALWWYRGVDSYVLYRGLGVLLMLSVAFLVVTAFRASGHPVVPETSEWATGRVLPLGLVPDVGPLFGDLTRGQLARALLVLPLLTMGFVAVPVNLSTVDDGDGDVAGRTTVQVRDYTVTYAEDVPNRKVSVVDVSLFGETTSVNTSGVIVVSEERSLWTREISPGELAFDGDLSVRLGGVGWEERVDVARRGWTATGGGTAYQVWMRPPDGEWQHAYASEPKTADPVVAGRNVTVVPEAGEFYLQVSAGNETTGRAEIPTENGTVTAGGLTFVRDGERLLASANRTRVTIAKAETYE